MSGSTRLSQFPSVAQHIRETRQNQAADSDDSPSSASSSTGSTPKASRRSAQVGGGMGIEKKFQDEDSDVGSQRTIRPRKSKVALPRRTSADAVRELRLGSSRNPPPNIPLPPVPKIQNRLPIISPEVKARADARASQILGTAPPTRRRSKAAVANPNTSSPPLISAVKESTEDNSLTQVISNATDTSTESFTETAITSPSSSSSSLPWLASSVKTEIEEVPQYIPREVYLRERAQGKQISKSVAHEYHEYYKEFCASPSIGRRQSVDDDSTDTSRPTTAINTILAQSTSRQDERMNPKMCVSAVAGGPIGAQDRLPIMSSGHDESLANEVVDSFLEPFADTRKEGTTQNSNPSLSCQQKENIPTKISRSNTIIHRPHSPKNSAVRDASNIRTAPGQYSLFPPPTPPHVPPLRNPERLPSPPQKVPPPPSPRPQRLPSLRQPQPQSTNQSSRKSDSRVRSIPEETENQQAVVQYQTSSAISSPAEGTRPGTAKNSIKSKLSSASMASLDSNNTGRTARRGIGTLFGGANSTANLPVESPSSQQVNWRLPELRMESTSEWSSSVLEAAGASRLSSAEEDILQDDGAVYVNTNTVENMPSSRLKVFFKKLKHPRRENKGRLDSKDGSHAESSLTPSQTLRTRSSFAELLRPSLDIFKRKKAQNPSKPLRTGNVSSTTVNHFASGTSPHITIAEPRPSLQGVRPSRELGRDSVELGTRPGAKSRLGFSRWKSTPNLNIPGSSRLGVQSHHGGSVVNFNEPPLPYTTGAAYLNNILEDDRDTSRGTSVYSGLDEATREAIEQAEKQARDQQGDYLDSEEAGAAPSSDIPSDSDRISVASGTWISPRNRFRPTAPAKYPSTVDEEA